jgi:hypothetical protein
MLRAQNTQDSNETAGTIPIRHDSAEGSTKKFTTDQPAQRGGFRKLDREPERFSTRARSDWRRVAWRANAWAKRSLGTATIIFSLGMLSAEPYMNHVTRKMPLRSLSMRILFHFDHVLHGGDVHEAHDHVNERLH